jgi:hypothetical protein
VTVRVWHNWCGSSNVTMAASMTLVGWALSEHDSAQLRAMSHG